MAKEWDYAKLSKLASENGGPQKLIDKLISKSKSEGKSDMIPWVIGIAAGASAVTALVVKIIDNVQKKKNEKEIAALRKELIEGIEKYDKDHSELPDKTSSNDEQEGHN